MITLFWRLLLICFALAIIFYGIAFSYYNSQALSIDLVFSQLPALPSGLLILVSLLAGFCLALLAFSFSIGRLRIRNSLLKNKIAQLEKKSAAKSAAAEKQASSQPTVSKGLVTSPSQSLST